MIASIYTTLSVTSVPKFNLSLHQSINLFMFMTPQKTFLDPFRIIRPTVYHLIEISNSNYDNSLATSDLAHKAAITMAGPHQREVKVRTRHKAKVRARVLVVVDLQNNLVEAVPKGDQTHDKTDMKLKEVAADKLPHLNRFTQNHSKEWLGVDFVHIFPFILCDKLGSACYSMVLRSGIGNWLLRYYHLPEQAEIDSFSVRFSSFVSYDFLLPFSTFYFIFTACRWLDD